MTKLLRVPRIIQLLDVDRVKSIINNRYQRQLDNAIRLEDHKWSFPIT